MLSVKLDPWLALQSLFEWMTTPAEVRAPVADLSFTLEEITADLFHGRD